MPSALREQPPLDLVEQCLRCVGLKSIQDSTLFKKDFIDISKLEQLLPELEPYYLPCKANDFIHNPLTPSRAITIYRQILKPHNAKLIPSEKSSNGVKTTWYSVHCKISTNALLTISFS